MAPPEDTPVSVPLADRLPFRAAATVVLLRAANAGPEVLMMRRSTAAAHFAGSFVFPGGVVDPADSDPRALKRVVGLDETEANRRLGLQAGAIAHWVAVIRECYEEAGILIALEESGHPISPDRVARLEGARAALNERSLGFTEFLERERLLLPAASVAYFAHWITPPIQRRRFDTRFFLALAPEGQDGVHDDGEMIETAWLPPAEVLARAKRKEMEIARPTRQVLIGLSKFDAPGKALSHVASLETIMTNRACIATGREGRKIFHADQAPYAEIHWVDPDETGESTYDMVPGVAKKLDRYVTRLIAPNPGPMTGPGTNTYLVGERELALIDPGPAVPSHIQAILAAGAGRIRWILCTHTHRDHSPAAAAIKQATGAQCVGRPPPANVETHDQTLVVDRMLADGEELAFDGISLRALATPGHASNHLCYLLQPTRMLFTGDHVMQGSTVVIPPPDGNMRTYLASLRRLLELELAILAPGHGYLIGTPHAEVEKLVRHRLAREDKVRRALAEAGGSATLETILPRVYDDVPAAIHPMAARSLRAHLEKLVEDGELALVQGRYRRS